MPASRKLRTAHFLMFMAAVPLLVAGVILIIGIASAQANPDMGEALAASPLIALILSFSYPTTVVLGGGGALWSLFLTSRQIDSPTTATRVLRIMIFSGIAIPFGCLIVAVQLLQHSS